MNDFDRLPKFYKIPQAAEILQVKERTLEAWIRLGVIPFTLDIYRAGEAEGDSEDVLKRIKPNLRIKARRQGDGWYWYR